MEELKSQIIYQFETRSDSVDSMDSGVEDTDDHINEITFTTSLQTMKNVAIVLSVYISLTTSNPSHRDPKPLYLKKYKTNLKKIVDKILEKNKVLFQRMIKSLKLTDRESSRHAIKQVAKELFSGPQINWGRIFTLYAFVGELAKYGEESFSKDQNSGEYAKYIGKVAGEFVNAELTPWINKQGGWETVIAYAKKQDALEVKLMKGMFGTIFEIGFFAWKVIK